MRFYQIMEFRASAEDAVADIHRYKETMAGQTTARRATVCVDRDDPGLVVQIVEFDSYEEAMANNAQEGTQEAAAEAEAETGGITYRNLEVVEVVDV
ncbi:MAG TPA: hypothetical protein DGF10_07690 [Acidimicrobiaceae bacterium]|nr:hypothetical protein [Acidimicrobiaceae bacterium]HCV34536.1 hypothetical protein [Acidimicrobiaceae bacterium]|tara:strand:+ start:465 stop:755 length:291 start_codon:yes stop_codon:yes gene_type:complete